MRFEDFQTTEKQDFLYNNDDYDLAQSYVKEDIRRELSRGLESIKEAQQLIENDTIDSYLRYFQTSVYEGVHLPTLMLKNDTVVQKLLSNKMEPLINQMGLNWNKDALYKEGKLELTYTKSGISLNFASFNPTQRTLEFNFDIDEMERDREIRVHKIRQAMLETQERWTNTVEYLEESDGSFFKKIINFRNKRTIERLKGNVDNISDELSDMQDELESLMKNEILLENIKAKLPMMEREFSRFGIKIKFAKGEDYHI